MRFSLQILPDMSETVRKACVDLGSPLVEEYDFHKDRESGSLQSSLKPSTKVRPYQERCLRTMFGNGRARSGIVVLVKNPSFPSSEVYVGVSVAVWCWKNLDGNRRRNNNQETLHHPLQLYRRGQSVEGPVSSLHNDRTGRACVLHIPTQTGTISRSVEHGTPFDCSIQP